MELDWVRDRRIGRPKDCHARRPVTTAKFPADGQRARFSRHRALACFGPAIYRKSFAVFERPAAAEMFTIDHDILTGHGRSYDLSGRDLAAPDRRLRTVEAHQEFWHSWRTFHPGTGKSD